MRDRQLSKYIKIFPYQEKPGYVLLYSTKRASTILVDESLLKAIEERSLSTSDRETLVSLGFLVPDGAKEEKEMLSLFDEANRKNNRFSAVVVMNLDCNLACKYCFEGGIKGRHYMSSGMADIVIDYIEKQHLSNKKDISLDFYGGEPLLSFEQIKYLAIKLMASAEEKGRGCSFGLVTNGTMLTGKRAEELASLGLKDAKITIDGPRGNHNRFRPFKSGLGSFDHIIKNIREACDFIKIQIGGNFTRENYRVFPQLLDYFLKTGITPDKISMVKFDPASETVEKCGLPDFNEGCNSINEPWLFEASLFLREEILKRGFTTPKIREASCMIEFKADIVINWDGSLYKCPGFIGNKNFEVGDLRKGIKDYRISHNLDFWKKQECLDCEYLPLCFGGCRYMRILKTGKIDDVDCRKPYLDATLETFIKQEIKYGLKTDRT